MQAIPRSRSGLLFVVATGRANRPAKPTRSSAEMGCTAASRHCELATVAQRRSLDLTQSPVARMFRLRIPFRCLRPMARLLGRVPCEPMWRSSVGAVARLCRYRESATCQISGSPGKPQPARSSELDRHQADTNIDMSGLVTESIPSLASELGGKASLYWIVPSAIDTTEQC